MTVQASVLENREAYIEILDRESQQRIVTVIEVLSPANKWPGEGRKEYRKKQVEVFSSEAHLVEIDLLRTGRHAMAVPAALARDQGPYHYLTCINRATESRDKFDLYLGRLQARLPRIKIPLAGNDPEVVLDLQAVLAHTYEAGVYRHILRYEQPCRPPLTTEEQAWADQLIAASKNQTANGDGPV